MIRDFQKEDRDSIESMIQRIDNFTQEEKLIALELIDDKVLNGEKSHYTIYVYIKDLKLIGYYCIGLRPLTDGVYDIYWIVTDPEFRKEGAGKSLLEHAENFVKERDGRDIVNRQICRHPKILLKKQILDSLRDKGFL